MNTYSHQMAFVTFALRKLWAGYRAAIREQMT